jgi:TonB family protein
MEPDRAVVWEAAMAAASDPAVEPVTVPATAAISVSAPVPIYKPEPEYSEEARKAKFQGTVVLFIVVDEKGNARDLRVIRPLGLGLDQKAIEAVNKWKFRPGMKDGHPVSVQATIEVNFRLL